MAGRIVSGRKLATLLMMACALPSGLAHEDGSEANPGPTALNLGTLPATTLTNLPPLPEGVAALKFSEFFKNPAGPRGLEFTDKLRELHGRRVRILGRMVRQTEPTPGKFFLAPRTVQLHEHEFGLADDLPPASLRVFTHPEDPADIRFTPGFLLLTGTLQTGRAEEPDGRVTFVRLQLDRATGTTASESPGEAPQSAPTSVSSAQPLVPAEYGSTNPKPTTNEP